MKTAAAIDISGLGKCYRVVERQDEDMVRELIMRAATAPMRAIKSRLSKEKQDKSKTDFWALRDIGFSVAEGEVVGIIGRNGAGKSTLLKVLAGITEPTTGYADVRGRVGSLLEVGTGFHRELTGRENIYMNGALLGMRRSEIRRNFDEIVDFAEVDRFLDTPVKRYSSGMYMRLAFAVAAHLEPEILLIDEVLAVGDAAFQKKCLGKMEDVAHEGRTVLFVSHNMTAMQSLCSRVVWLDQGQVREEGPSEEVIQRYLNATTAQESVDLSTRENREGDGTVRITSVSVETTDSDAVVRCSSRLRLRVNYSADGPVRNARIYASMYDSRGTGIYLLDSQATGGLPDVLPSQGSLICETDAINLTPGRCHFNLKIHKGGAVADYVADAICFDVEADDFYGSGRMPARDWVLGLVHHRWQVKEDQA